MGSAQQGSPISRAGLHEVGGQRLGGARPATRYVSELGAHTGRKGVFPVPWIFSPAESVQDCKLKYLNYSYIYMYD